jgi:hypothetical protein
VAKFRGNFFSPQNERHKELCQGGSILLALFSAILQTHLVTLASQWHHHVTYIDIAKRTYAMRCTKYLWNFPFCFDSERQTSLIWTLALIQCTDLHLEGSKAAAMPIPPLLPKMAPHQSPTPPTSSPLYRQCVQISTTCRFTDQSIYRNIVPGRLFTFKF